MAEPLAIANLIAEESGTGCDDQPSSYAEIIEAA
jgi:hypothetical protein